METPVSKSCQQDTNELVLSPVGHADANACTKPLADDGVGNSNNGEAKEEMEEIPATETTDETEPVVEPEPVSIQIGAPACASCGPTWVALVWKELPIGPCDYVVQQLKVRRSTSTLESN